MENSSLQPRTNETESAHGWQNINTIVYIIGVISTIWTIGANLLILVCFFRNRRRPWTTFSQQTCSMSISDLMVGLTAIPFLIVEQHGGRTQWFLCYFTFYMFFSAQCVTLYHVLGVCLLRLITLKQFSDPLPRSRGCWYASGLIMGAWVMAFLVILIPILLWNKNLDGTERIMYCSVDKLFGDNHKKAFVYIAFSYFVSQCFTNIIYIVACARFWMELRKVVPVQSVSGVQTVSESISTEARSSQYPTGSSKSTGDISASSLPARSATRLLNVRTNSLLQKPANCSARRIEVSPSEMQEKNNTLCKNVHTDLPHKFPSGIIQKQVTAGNLEEHSHTTSSKHLTRSSLHGHQTRGRSHEYPRLCKPENVFEGRTGSRAVNSVNISTSNALQPTSSILKSQKRVIGTIGILLFLFNVFTLPVTVGIFMEKTKPGDRNLRFIVSTLFLMNSGLNPIVYATRITSLRRAVIKVFQDIANIICF